MVAYTAQTSTSVLYLTLHQWQFSVAQRIGTILYFDVYTKCETVCIISHQSCNYGTEDKKIVVTHNNTQ